VLQSRGARGGERRARELPASEARSDPRQPTLPYLMANVFLDCDGVLADFDKGATAVFGMKPAAFERRFGLKRFWQKLAAAPEFFATLDLMPDAVALYRAVEHLHPVILTGLPHGDWAAPQKRRWAAWHFPRVPVITTTAALKYEHCHPGDALIDDRDRHRHLWEGAGGIFVHHKSAAASLDKLRRHGFDVPLCEERRRA
jgi:hypothetical protein